MRQVLIYALLLLGGIVFAWPFLWMASTSVKLERELFGGHSRGLPPMPRPPVRSPYIDEREYANVSGPRAGEAIRLIAQQLPGEPREALARAVYSKLLTLLPADTWKQSELELKATLQHAVSPELIAGTTAELRRVFCIGRLRARSFDAREDQLVAPETAATAWQVGGSVTARLVPVATNDEQFAELHYDFATGDNVSLSQTFTTSFPANDLHRLQLYARNDDSWHALNVKLEKNGVLYRAERAVDLADRDWAIHTWQFRRADDLPNKIKTWTWLREADRAGQYLNSPNEIKLTIELQRRSTPAACLAKLLRNYRLTLDYIPFWRYVGTSVFLLIINITATLFSCSLVAYSFARLQWPGREICFALLLATMMLPVQVVMIPQFLIMQKLGWFNTLTPLWVASFFAPAFYVFLLRQFLKGVPRDLEDAARLDGCGFLRIYWHIMLPLIRPALAAIAIFTFLATWNEFMGPLIYLADQRLYPLSFGLYAFQVQSLQPGTTAGIGMLMAAALLMMLPVIAMFFFAQRYFLQGVTLTGMKG